MFSRPRRERDLFAPFSRKVCTCFTYMILLKRETEPMLESAFVTTLKGIVCSKQKMLKEWIAR